MSDAEKSPTGDAPDSGVWRRNLHILSLTQVITVTGMGIALPLIPFFVRELGVTDRAEVEKWSGLIFSGPFLAAALMSPVWGWLGDRHGHKMIVVRAVAGLAVVNLLIMFVQTPAQFWVIRLVQGLVTGFIPASLAITSATTPTDELPGALGRLQASASAGRLLGPAIGGVLAGFLAFREIFLVVGVLMGISTVIVLFGVQNPPVTARPRTPWTDNFRYVVGDPRTSLGLAGLVLSMAGLSCAMPIFALFVEDALGPEVDASFWTGIGFAFVAGATLVASSFLGRASARWGLKPVLVTALLVAACAMAAHPFARDIPALLAARALLGVGTAGISPVILAMISRHAPEEIRGGVTGFASSATIFGFFLGPMAGGQLANHIGIEGVFFSSACLLLICAVVAGLVARRLGRDRTIVAQPEPTPR